MDELVKKLSGFGIPVIILLVFMNASGLTGAAALTAALAALGPGGMVCGIGLLLVISLSADKIAEVGYEKITILIIKEQLKTVSKEDMIKKINKYLITKKMKLKIIAFIENA